MKQILESINKLPPSLKDCLIMRDVQGYSYQEIAKILNLPGAAAPRILNLRSHGQARGKLEDIVHELLETLQRTADEIEAEDGSLDAEDPPTPKRGRRKKATKRRAGSHDIQ